MKAFAAPVRRNGGRDRIYISTVDVSGPRYAVRGGDGREAVSHGAGRPRYSFGLWHRTSKVDPEPNIICGSFGRAPLAGAAVVRSGTSVTCDGSTRLDIDTDVVPARLKRALENLSPKLMVGESSALCLRIGVYPFPRCRWIHLPRTGRKFTDTCAHKLIFFRARGRRLRRDTADRRLQHLNYYAILYRNAAYAVTLGKRSSKRVSHLVREGCLCNRLYFSIAFAPWTRSLDDICRDYTL
ncbi:hypothetical protein EVAR_20866_1 [Eumeta japonica]|uniref:Uncharacterized protein n=1 Tax=Eumeta variegata TaxID=151549 RepID=A0A4C1UWM4_EUMVA|nr:hypothetical protein EVAR_20866_1 [Eumeta japonica]